MLHFENIFFSETGLVKIQEMSHLFFNQYSITGSDLIFLPPEALICGKVSEKGDVWTLGIILLICLSLEFELESAGTNISPQEIVRALMQISNGDSVVNLDEERGEDEQTRN